MSNSFQHERRAAQRFPFHVPIAIRMGEDEKIEVGFTQDISARGAFFYTVGAVAEGSRLQVSFTMPSTITLTEDMRILCTGEAVRIERLADGIRMGVAVRLRDYEFLPTANTDASLDRIHSLHGRRTGAEDSSL